jgi:hypothetical protein
VEKSKSKHVWTTKDGREIVVGDMSDSHLLRTIRLLECRAVTIGLSDYSAFGKALGKKLQEQNLENVSEHLKALKAEAERRKLGDWARFGVALVQKVLE